MTIRGAAPVGLLCMSQAQFIFAALVFLQPLDGALALESCAAVLYVYVYFRVNARRKVGALDESAG